MRRKKQRRKENRIWMETDTFAETKKGQESTASRTIMRRIFGLPVQTV